MVKLSIHNITSLEKIYLGSLIFFFSNRIGDLGLIPKTITKIFTLLSLYLILIGYIRVKKRITFPSALKSILSFYIGYSSIIGIIMIIGLNKPWYTLLLTDMIWVYYLPLLGLIDYKRYKWEKYAYKYAWISIILSFIFIILNYKFIFILEKSSVSIGIAVLPLMFTIPIFAFFNHAILENKLYKLILIFSVIFCFYTSIISGKRTNLYICIFYLISYIWIFLHSTKHKVIIKFILITTTLVASFYIYQSSTFEYMGSRLNIENRDTLINDYQKTMTPINWIFGKGANGSYSTFNEEEGRMTNRTFIENAFLNIILKGGILLLLPYIILIIYCIVKLYKSNKFNETSGTFYMIYLTGNIISLMSLMPQVSLIHTILWSIIGSTLTSNSRHIKN